ncbi:MAG: hypothetical protein NTY09_01350 [bacterium]|nr:hypothetical protein [bacterium]
MPINWRNIRALNGSQNAAFEELCCQLAHNEKPAEDAVFIRKGAPDAGIECFWTLASGDLIAWQAKYFIATPGDNQWAQLDDSVKKALEKHPTLTTYIICIPLDRQDPRIDQEEWFMDKWDNHVRKWEQWVSDKTMKVQFEYWGSHELLEKLAQPKHAGRSYFFFNADLFHNPWLIDKFQRIKADVGNRYLPQIDVELPIYNLFDSLGRTSSFLDRIKKLLGLITSSGNDSITNKSKTALKIEFERLERDISSLSLLLSGLPLDPQPIIDWESIQHSAKQALATSEACNDLLAGLPDPKQKSDLSFERHGILNLMRHIQSVIYLTESRDAILANTPVLLLTGVPGTEKTHLLCHICEDRLNHNQPTIMLLGAQFNSSTEPLQQVMSHLGLRQTINDDEFLGALNSSAEAYNTRLLIFIDALNETDDRNYWHVRLAGFIQQIRRYPYLGVCISIRTSYKEVCLPNSFLGESSAYVTYEHEGFRGVENQATTIIFKEYGIEIPSSPIIYPEFSNPLFLVTLCGYLQQAGMTRLPKGHTGITWLFENYFKEMDRSISRLLGTDQKDYLVKQAMAIFIDQIVSQKSYRLKRSQIKTAIEALLPGRTYENSLYRAMIHHGLICEEPGFAFDGDSEEVVFIIYERFTDHLLARNLLEKNVDEVHLTESFAKGSIFHDFYNDEHACWKYQGLLEALSIIVPERYGKELFEVADYLREFKSTKQAFLESLLWRDRKSFSKATIEYVNKDIIAKGNLYDLLNTLLMIATNPEHPFNADRLHSYLLPFEMAERDSFWALFLHNIYSNEEYNSVQRLIDWAWDNKHTDSLDDDVILLTGTVLGWFLTSSNRFIRDKSTKALVNLFTEKLAILIKLLERFNNIDDLYIIERLLAVAYGCSMRSSDTDGIKAVALYVYSWIFDQGEIIPHLLIRDYAKGIIDLAQVKGIRLSVDINRADPPYGSSWSDDVPTESELKTKYGDWENAKTDKQKAWSSMYHRIFGLSDFSLYIIGTNHPFSFEWMSYKLGDTIEPTKDEIIEQFIETLTEKQKRTYEKYQTNKYHAFLKEFVNDVGDKKQIVVRHRGNRLGDDREMFIKTLGKQKRDTFENIIEPLYKSTKTYEHDFDLTIAQRWIFNRIVEMGWSPELFGRFDGSVNYWESGRGTHKPERIGKKYQWIAYHEFLARIADNFVMRDERLSEKPGTYQGAWQVRFRRDIDPSCVIRKKIGGNYLDQSEVRWLPYNHEFQMKCMTHEEWLKSTEGMPDFKAIIDYSLKTRRWLCLNTYSDYMQPIPVEEEKYKIERRQLVFWINSYLVKKEDKETLIKWLKEQDRQHGRMPGSPDDYGIFLGEYFWSPCYRHLEDPYYGDDGWSRGQSDEIPVPIMATHRNYCQEGNNFDCSIEDSIFISIPVRTIAQGMGLQWHGNEGEFADETGAVIAFDPSVKIGSPKALLIEKDSFAKFLEAEDLEIVWVVEGEKRMIGGSHTDRASHIGRLDFRGIYHLENDSVAGDIISEYDSYLEDLPATESPEMVLYVPVPPDLGKDKLE